MQYVITMLDAPKAAGFRIPSNAYSRRIADSGTESGFPPKAAFVEVYELALSAFVSREVAERRETSIPNSSPIKRVYVSSWT